MQFFFFAYPLLILLFKLDNIIIVSIGHNVYYNMYRTPSTTSVTYCILYYYLLLSILVPGIFRYLNK